VAGDDALGEFLLAGARPGIEALFGCVIGKFGQPEFAPVDAASELAAPPLVALLPQPLQLRPRATTSAAASSARAMVSMPPI
jgi:hypothetical protein